MGKKWNPTEPMKPGDYDLVTIWRLGHDPVSGMSYEECNRLYSEALNRNREALKRCPRWNFILRFILETREMVLDNRFAAGPYWGEHE